MIKLLKKILKKNVFKNIFKDLFYFKNFKIFFYKQKTDVIFFGHNRGVLEKNYIKDEYLDDITKNFEKKKLMSFQDHIFTMDPNMVIKITEYFKLSQFLS